MIVVQDKINLAAADLPRLRRLVEERYLPAARARGLVLMDSGISPPLALDRQPNTLWLRWQLADIGAFWTMRAMAGMDPGVAAFWAEVDSFCPARQRDFLRPDGLTEAPLPAPQLVAPFLTQPRGWRETTQLHLRPEADAAAQEALEAALARITELPGVLDAHLGRNLVVAHGAGHYTWDVRYESAGAATAAKATPLWSQDLGPLLAREVDHVECLGLETVGAGNRRPDLAAGIKRTALFRLLPGVSTQKRTIFEQGLLEMPAYIPEIVNWRLSRAIPAAVAGKPDWDYVWEQEYTQLEGLNVAYMIHPHHWAYLDGYFDPESGRQMVETRLCHAYCPLQSSILGRESGPLGKC